MKRLTLIEKMSILVGIVIALTFNILIFNYVLEFPKTVTAIIVITTLIGGIIAYIGSQKSKGNKDYLLKQNILIEMDIKRIILYSIWGFFSAIAAVCSLYYLSIARVSLGLLLLILAFVLAGSLAFTLRKK
ncbi:MAG: hypothetical protein C4549_07260 [Deltaproteobacteria bacterium]|jgi:hypothetical protein|nr:MAG: hypothetical protein C4549_07260 [Deltaproteobacteria bacterium]